MLQMLTLTHLTIEAEDACYWTLTKQSVSEHAARLEELRGLDKKLF